MGPIDIPGSYGPRRKRAAGGALGIALLLVLAACGGGKTATTGTDAGASGIPIAGDTLNIGEQQAPTWLNPGAEDLGFVDFTMLSYESLFYLAPDGSVQPALAK